MSESRDCILLREHFEALLLAQREIFEARLDAMDRATELQAEANRVHFVGLNNEQARIAKLHDQYLPRELYRASEEKNGEWRATVEQRLNARAGEQTGSGHAWALGLGVLGALLGLAAFVAMMLGGSGA